MRKLMVGLFIVMIAGMTTGCIHPQVKFRKAKLLDPMMDPSKTGGLYSSAMYEPQGWNEKASAESGGSLGGSCPTCGG